MGGFPTPAPNSRASSHLELLDSCLNKAGLGRVLLLCQLPLQRRFLFLHHPAQHLLLGGQQQLGVLAVLFICNDAKITERQNSELTAVWLNSNFHTQLIF